MTKSSKICTYCKPRILVVDNKSSVRRDRAYSLRRWHCEPVIAQGQGQDLLDDAVRKAKEYRCHVAIVDMRLIDDEDQSDISGLELLEKLKPARCIVVSGYLNLNRQKEALLKRGAHDVIERGDAPRKLLSAIREQFAQYCGCSVAISWPSNRSLQEILDDLGLEEVKDFDEIRCVITRLFASHPEPDLPNITEVVLKPMPQHYNIGASPYMSRSTILVARAKMSDGSWQKREVIKVACCQKIKAESDNYRKWVRPYLSPTRTARIESERDATFLWNLGGIRYTDVAVEQHQPLHRWYRDAEPSEIKEAIKDLFTKTLNWDKSPVQPATHGFIFDYYSEAFPKTAKRIREYANPDQANELMIAGCVLPDPVVWVKAHAHDSGFITHWSVPTHGDLHSDNVYVEHVRESIKTIVIDFEKTGPGYFMRDFVELEADIRLRLLSIRPEQLPLALCFDLCLLAQRDPSEEPLLKGNLNADPQTLSELQKAFDGIVTLRELARIAGLRDMREYYWALLMETMISVMRDYSKWRDQALARFARDRALLSAALICKRLDHWDNTKWPPKELANCCG